MLVIKATPSLWVIGLHLLFFFILFYFIGLYSCWKLHHWERNTTIIHKSEICLKEVLQEHLGWTTHPRQSLLYSSTGMKQGLPTLFTRSDPNFKPQVLWSSCSSRVDQHPQTIHLVEAHLLRFRSNQVSMLGTIVRHENNFQRDFTRWPILFLCWRLYKNGLL